MMHPASAERARLSGNTGFWTARVEQQKKAQEAAAAKAQQAKL